MMPVRGEALPHRRRSAHASRSANVYVAADDLMFVCLFILFDRLFDQVLYNVIAPEPSNSQTIV